MVRQKKPFGSVTCQQQNLMGHLSKCGLMLNIKSLLFSLLTSVYDLKLLLLSSHPGDASAGLFHTGADGIHLRGKTQNRTGEPEIKE